MDDDLMALDQRLHVEADQILEQQGLRPILSLYGTPHVVGSYALHLMVWRDLDITLETTSIGETAFFALGGAIAAALHPVRMSFRNERIARSPGLPHGLYWGIYTGPDRADSWKIDIWAVDPEECRRLLAIQEQQIAARLSAETRSRILQIKAQCWQEPGYHRTFTSMDIYRAVLDEGIADVTGFRESLRQKGLA